MSGVTDKPLPTKILAIVYIIRIYTHTPSIYPRLGLSGFKLSHVLLFLGDPTEFPDQMAHNPSNVFWFFSQLIMLGIPSQEGI